MGRVEVYTGYVARPVFEPFHNRTEREAIMVCHRRAGKTVAICNDAQERCLMLKRAFPPARIAWFYPTRVRAKDIAWPYLKHYSHAIPGVRVIESELAIEYPNKGRVTLYGADNSRGVGLWLDGAYYDEDDEIPQSVVSEVAPTLADYGGFSVYAGMLKGRYNLWKRYSDAISKPDTYKLLLRASESGIIPPDELERLRNTMGDAAYQMQLECNANAAIANAIYGVEMDNLRKEGRLRAVAADPASPLYTFWDIGHADTGDDWTLWLIQFVQRDVLFLDYHANTGKVPAYYANIVRNWEDKYRNRVAMNYLPHDGGRRDQIGKTTQNHLEDAGLSRIRLVPRTPEIWNGINTLRGLLPRVYINQTECTKPWAMGEQEMPSGVDCLDYYTKKQDVTTGLIKDVPVHNQYSHGADAARTFAEAYAMRMIDGTSELAEVGRRTNLVVTREPIDHDRGRATRRFTVSR